MDTKDFMQLPIWLFSLVAAKVAPSDNYKGRFLTFWYRLVIFEVTFAVSMYIHKMISNLDNIELMIGAVYLVTSSTFAWMKFMTFARQSESFHELVDDLRSMINKDDATDMDSFFKVNQSCNKVLKAFVGFSMFTVFSDILKSVFNYFKYSLREYPYKISFFFDIYSPFIYEVTFISFFVGVSGLAFAYSLMDTLFFSFGKNIVNHLKILNKNFKNLKAEDFKGKNNRLNELIEYHNKIIDCCDRLNHLYNPVLLTQFIFAAICICMVVFQVVWADNLAQKLSSLGFMCGNLASLYFYNIVGTEIIEQSLNLTNSIYEIDEWFNLPIKTRKKLVFVMTRSQKPFIIRAGFYQVTLHTFTYILKSITSYLALLESVHK